MPAPKIDEHHDEKIVRVEKLTPEVLKSFLNHEICAIVVSNYIETSLCDRLTKVFLDHQSEDYHHEVREGEKIHYLTYGVNRIGVAFNTTYNHPVGSPEWQRYYNEAMQGTRFIRDAAYPYLSPIDHLRLEFDELWAPGANIANFEGRKMFVGIVRITEPKKDILEKPHCDAVPERFANLKSQYSANVYLSVPEEGGELEMWDMAPLPITEIDHADINKDWRNSGIPSLLVKPHQGDLILINTRRPHAVRKFAEGTRVSVQCFFGLKNDNSLVLWN